MASFYKGDIVQLKSGGPLMTVVESNRFGVTCQWFVNGQLGSARFEEDVLEEVKND